MVTAAERFKKVFSILVRQRLRWTLTGSRTVVVFDTVQINAISSLFPDEDFQVFDPRFENDIHVPSFLKGLFRWILSDMSFSFTHFYFEAFLRKAKPKLVLTTAYFSADFYTARFAVAKELQASFVVFQRGHISDFALVQTDKLTRRDKVMCLTEGYARLMSALPGEGKFFASGSLASKAEPLEDAPGKNGAAFISNWRLGQVRDGELYFSDGPHSTFYASEIQGLTPLHRALSDIGLELTVLGASIHNPEEEKKFYQSILGESGWAYLERASALSNYSKLSAFEILFCVDSTLGYEALSRNSRVMFLEPRSPRLLFGYPNHELLHDSAALLSFTEEKAWATKIREILAMTDQDFQGVATNIIGRSPLDSNISDLRTIILE